MLPTVRFKLTTSQPIERFTNLSPAVYAHTVVIWAGSLAAKTDPDYSVKYVKS